MKYQSRIVGLAAAVTLSSLAALPSYAAPLNIDFGATTVAGFGAVANAVGDGVGGVSEMLYATVAPGVNASIVAHSLYTIDPSYDNWANATAVPGDMPNREFNGSAVDDARIHMPASRLSTYTLSLWDASVGSGYEAAFGGGAVEWNLTFFDLDSNAKSHDVLTLLSPATYILTETTNLIVNNTGTAVSFSGENVGSIAGQEGLDTLTQEQADASVEVKVIGSILKFGYEAPWHPLNTSLPPSQGRNLLIDGGTLFGQIPNPAPPVDFAPVPLPAAGFLLLATCGALGGMSHRRKAIG